MKMALIALLAASLCGSVIAQTLPFIRVDPVSNRFLDEAGRVRFFHGVNVVEKEPPFYPTFLASPANLALYEEAGFNMVRLGVLWIGVEPERGQMNQTYVDISNSIAAQFAQHGMYVLVDSHQDIFSPAYCGDGAPAWAAVPRPDAKPFAEPIGTVQPIDLETGYPSECGEHAWAAYYLTEACSSAFQSLYDNRDGIQDHFVSYWELLARTFANQSGVIGLELINEPWAGDIFQDPLLLVPGVADHKNLQKMYDRLNAAIRQQWANHTIFYESVTWDVSPVGFTAVPGGKEFADRSVLSWHYYCWIFDADMKPIDWVLCNVTKSDFFDVRKSDVKRLGGAGFLTEFGLCSAVPSEYGPGGYDECLLVLEAADRHLDSWSYWAADELFNASGVIPENIRLFSRTYAMAVSGEPLKMQFDSATSAFTLQFIPNPHILLPTEVYLNEAVYYPTGYKVNVQPAGLTWTSAHNRVYLNTTMASGKDVVTLTIVRPN